MSKSRPSRIRRSEKQWTAILRRFRSSGLSIRQFCSREGLPQSSLQRWKSRLAPSASPAEFVELTPSAREDDESWELEVALPNGVRLHFRG